MAIGKRHMAIGQIFATYGTGMSMALTITLEQAGDFGVDEFRSAIAGSLSRELKQAIGRRDFFRMRCRGFEERYGMSSDQFVESLEAGTLDDDADFFDWFGDKQLLDS